MASSVSSTLPSGDRILVVDALRAFALLGIIVTHACTGFLVGAPPAPDFMSFSEFDRLVARWVPILVEGKFFAIFSFLFGLSFAIQLDRADRAGKSFAGRYAWRLIVLLGIGFIHSLFFGGDILMIYALLGLLLLPMHKLRSRTLVITALVLVLNLPGLILGSMFMAAAPAPGEQQESQQSQQAQYQAMAERQYEIKRHGSVGELVHMNLTEAMQNRFFYQVFTGRLWITYGLFLLGICAGRARLFESGDRNRLFFRRLLLASGIVAAFATAVVASQPATFELTLRYFLGWYIGSVQHSVLAAFYVAAMTLWLWRPAAAAVNHMLVPMGKAGLTTYLSQSAFGIAVFYGFGLGMLGVLGVAASIGVSVAFFVLQLFLARWWMQRFRFGPVEWLWRSLTDLRLHPLRVQPVEVAPAA